MSGDPNLFYTAFGRSAGHRNTKLGAKFRSVNDARLTSTQEFIQLNGATPLTSVPGFSLWRSLALKTSCGVVEWKSGFRGLMPDLLHIADLGVTQDAILSALIEWSTPPILVIYMTCELDA